MLYFPARTPTTLMMTRLTKFISWRNQFPTSVRPVCVARTLLLFPKAILMFDGKQAVVAAVTSTGIAVYELDKDMAKWSAAERVPAGVLRQAIGCMEQLLRQRPPEDAVSSGAVAVETRWLAKVQGRLQRAWRRMNKVFNLEVRLLFFCGIPLNVGVHSLL